MRWLKHLSASSQDEKLSEILAIAGPEGYGVWWLILERIAINMDPEKDPSCTSCRISLKSWANFCHISTKKMQNFVKTFEKIGLVYPKYEKINPLFITIDVPNIAKYRDEYTKRKARSADKVRTNSRQAPDKVRPKKETQIIDREAETEAETEEEKKEKKEKKKTPTAKPRETNSTPKKKDDYIDNIWKLCSQVRHSYRESGLAPITGKGRAHIGTISKFAKQQFELNEWPVSTENTLAYIGLLYEAFMNYDGDERDKKTGEDWIKKHKYPFGSFVQGLEKWAEKAAKVTDSTGRKVYVPLKVPEDVLKFDTCGSGCDHSTARVEAFIKRNKNHAKQIREFKAMAKDGLKYDEYMKEKTGDGEEKADNDGQENTVSAGS